MISKKTALKSAILAATLAPVVAQASGYKINEQSASGVGNAYAGQAAMVEDASVVFYNPAGMVHLDRAQFTAGFSYLSGDGKFSAGEGTNAGGQPIAAGDGTYSDGGDFLGSAFIPYMYYARPVNEKMAIGLGIFTPFGTNTDYDSDFVGGGFADQTQLKSIDIQPTFAYKINDELSVGFGVDIVYMKGLLSKSVDSVPYSATLDQNVQGLMQTNPGLDRATAQGLVAAQAGVSATSPLFDSTYAGFENHYEVSGDDWGTGWNVGVMWKPTDATTLGFAYRSEIEVVLEGDSEFANDFYLYSSQADAVVPAGALSGNTSATVRKQASKVPLTTPQSATFSIAHQLTNNLMLQGGATWTGWSSFKYFDVIATENTSGAADGFTDISDISAANGLDDANGLNHGYIGHIVEEWKDVWAAAVGGSYQATPQLLVRAGYAYDQSPVTYKYRTARVPSSDRQWLTAGVQYRIDQDWSVDMGAAYLFMKEMELEEVNKDLEDNGFGAASVEGKYKINAFGLSFQVTYKM